MSTKSSIPSHIKKLYHATYVAYKESIISEGLKTGKASNWDGMESCGVIYLADDVDVAGSFAECADLVNEDVLESGICVFEVDVDAIDKSILQADPNIVFDGSEDIYSFIYTKDIPSFVLRLVVENY